MDHRLDLWNSIHAAISNPSTLNPGEAPGCAATARPDFTPRSAPPSPEFGRDDLESPIEKVRPILVIVDDEADVLQSVRALLRMDYQVVTFQQGSDALEFLRSTPRVHVILSDQKMPGMSGVEVLRQAMTISPETTRLLFTAYADIRTVVDAINQGNVFRYLAKPFDPDFLSRCEASGRASRPGRGEIPFTRRAAGDQRQAPGGQPGQRCVHRSRQPRA